MCTYNHEQYIAQAIKGVISQNCDVKFELLVGDDCSTDGTQSIVMRYVAQYPTIVKPVFPKKNLGASKNIINLAEHAQGEVLSICDGDDWWLRDDILQEQWKVFQNEPDVGMFCAKAKCFYQERQMYDGTLGYEGAESLERMVVDNRDVAAPTIAFRRALFMRCVAECDWYIEQNVFYDTIMAYWFAYNSKIRFVDEVLAAYRILNNSASHSSNEEVLDAYEKRYFSVKWHFLLEHPINSKLMYELLMREYDQLRRNAKWSMESKIRKSKTYRLGNFIIKPLKFIISVVEIRNLKDKI